VISTLLPHLPSPRIHEFRWALLGGIVAVIVLVLAGAVVPAILTAAVLVPVLYLVYLYEAQVYRDEPIRVLGLTVVAGAGLGCAVLFVARRLIPSSSPLEVAQATGVLIASAVLLPVVEEIVKPLPALILRRRPSFDETVDGLVFGVAAGLGFAAAQTIFNFSRIIGYERLHTSAGDWLFPVLGAAVLTPLMQASCTGAITASLWRRGRQGSRLLYAAGFPVALIGHIAFSLGSGLLLNAGAGQATVLIWEAAVVATLLLFIRALLHRALLDEAEDFGLHATVCPHCGRHVEAVAFCPHCGAAVRAAPRTEHGGLVSEAPAPPGEPAASGES
jgi:RsiW-degrading membrane proteinase PrsW (M82 family)